MDLNPIGRIRDNSRATKYKASVITTPQATVTSSFQTEDSDDETSAFANEMSSIYHLRSSSSVNEQTEVHFDCESFLSDPVDMVWMPGLSLEELRSSGLVTFTEKDSDEAQQPPQPKYSSMRHRHRRHSIDSARGLANKRCSLTTIRDSDGIWSTGGLGQFDLGVSQSETQDDFLDRTTKHRPTRLSEHKQFTRSLCPQDWESFVTDLYVLTPTSAGFFPQY